MSKPHEISPTEQPSECNDWAVDSADGVLVGRPPAYPAGLLDWDDPRADKGNNNVEAVTIICSEEGMANFVAPTTKYHVVRAETQFQHVSRQGERKIVVCDSEDEEDWVRV